VIVEDSNVLRRLLLECEHILPVALNSCLLAMTVEGAGKFFLAAGSNQDTDCNFNNHKCSHSVEYEALYSFK